MRGRCKYVPIRNLLCIALLVYGLLSATAVLAETTASPAIMSGVNTLVMENDEQPLTMQRAAHIATDIDPARKSYEAQAQALYEQAVSDGQLPDPTIRLGYLNVPTDTYSRSQEAMTQVLVGVQQVFPPGNTLNLREQQVNVMGQTMGLTAKLQHLITLRSVRDNWLEVFYWHTAAHVVQNSHALFTQLTAITRSQYATGRRNQQDVLRAEQELAVLKDREFNYQAEELRARASLARWIGQAEAKRPLPTDLPEHTRQPDLIGIQMKLDSHPLMQIARSRIAEQEQGVAIAKEAYKPRWMIDVSYGNREGNNPNGTPRSDFVSGMVSISVPLFTENRQDRMVAASRQRLYAAQDAEDLQKRKLQEDLNATQVQWQYLNKRIHQYQDKLIPQATQTANAALQAYQSDAGDFALLMRARINELETHLQLLKLRVDCERARNNLLFLSGEEK